MKTRIVGAALVAAVLGVAWTAEAQDSPAHRHMGHVADGFRGTPDGMGLLPAAQAEAEVAATHIGLALRAPDNLEGMQRHAGHVLHALDASSAENGPGRGYGLLRAAEGVATHIGLAAESDGASDNVKAHAQHVSTSANNVVTWSRRAIELCQQIQGASDAGAAAEMAEELQGIIASIQNGRDANGDGRTGWQEGEGGLAQAATHMGLMKRGEGM